MIHIYRLPIAGKPSFCQLPYQTLSLLSRAKPRVQIPRGSPSLKRGRVVPGSVRVHDYPGGGRVRRGGGCAVPGYSWGVGGAVGTVRYAVVGGADDTGHFAEEEKVCPFLFIKN